MLRDCVAWDENTLSVQESQDAASSAHHPIFQRYKGVLRPKPSRNCCSTPTLWIPFERCWSSWLSLLEKWDCVLVWMCWPCCASEGSYPKTVTSSSQTAMPPISLQHCLLMAHRPREYEVLLPSWGEVSPSFINYWPVLPGSTPSHKLQIVARGK